MFKTPLLVDVAIDYLEHSATNEIKTALLGVFRNLSVSNAIADSFFDRVGLVDLVTRIASPNDTPSEFLIRAVNYLPKCWQRPRLRGPAQDETRHTSPFN